jgi:hypothetical protein
MLIAESNQYKYAAKGPLDAKALVKTYADLFSTETWQVNTGTRIANGAYNGLITAVWLNKEDTSKNGIYYLHDSTVTSTLSTPDVTKTSNWHKILDAKDLTTLIAKIATNTLAIEHETAARIAAVEAIYKAGDDKHSASGLLAEEIVRATTAEQVNASAIATLVGNDSGKTAREIASEELAKIVDIGSQTISAYMAEKIAKIIQPKASSEVTVADDGTLGINEISTDKLIQGVKTLVLCGGCAI